MFEFSVNKNMEKENNNDKTENSSISSSIMFNTNCMCDKI